MILKVSEAKVGALVAHLRAQHPYETPEIVALAVDLQQTEPRYMAWVRGNSGESSP